MLLYLNVASLFAIPFSEVLAILPGSVVVISGSPISTGPDVRTAALPYFSLTTITTTGFGDIVAIHPITRSLANPDAVFGQLFPATLLARLVALQTAHGRRATESAQA